MDIVLGGKVHAILSYSGDDILRLAGRRQQYFDGQSGHERIRRDSDDLTREEKSCIGDSQMRRDWASSRTNPVTLALKHMQKG